MWRIWTRGFGPRDWWHWYKTDGFPMFVAWALPRRIALWTFIRVMAATELAPDQITYEIAYKAWEAGAGR